MTGIPRTVQRRAADQHGLITRRQLTAEGFTAGSIDGWLRRGHLTAVAHGVYRFPGAPVTPSQRALAMVFRAGAGAKAGPRTSAALHGLEGFTLGRGADVVVPPARRVTAVRFQVHPIDVRPPDVTIVDAIPALAAARTLIEIADLLPPRRLRVAVDSARRRGCLLLPELSARCDALRWRPGATTLRSILDEGVFVHDSEGERTMRATLFVGLDWELEGQVTDLVPGRRLDLAERLSLMGFEYDSRAHHVLPTDRDDDGLRDLECADHGVLILRITSGMLRNHLAETRARIIRIRERRLRELGVTANRSSVRPGGRRTRR